MNCGSRDCDCFRRFLNVDVARKAWDQRENAVFSLIFIFGWQHRVYKGQHFSSVDFKKVSSTTLSSLMVAPFHQVLILSWFCGFWLLYRSIINYTSNVCCSLVINYTEPALFKWSYYQSIKSLYSTTINPGICIKISAFASSSSIQ